MNKERLIQKWLDGELSPEELDAFKRLDEHDDYVKIAEAASRFKAPEFESTETYRRLQSTLTKRKKSDQRNFILKIAAIFVLVFATYFTFSNFDGTRVETRIADTEEIILPDGSTVKLNALSAVEYEEKSWPQNRQINLQGEAFFKVEKGNSFDVVTEAGTISVLGTQFNIKQRGQFFEVTCYEGLVAVKTLSDSILLPPGKSFRIIEGRESLGSTERAAPSWPSEISSFKSVPFKEVIAEFERQYKVDVRLKTLTFDTDQLFTGSFVHHKMETALQSISIPFNMVYTLDGDTVTLKVRD